jgi:hypothetical protein
MNETLAPVPALSSLDYSYYTRRLDGKGNCPGFRLWAALADNGVWYFMDGDHEGGVEVRLFFRSREARDAAKVYDRRQLPSRVVEAIDLGANPDVLAWDAFHPGRR